MHFKQLLNVLQMELIVMKLVYVVHIKNKDVIMVQMVSVYTHSHQDKYKVLNHVELKFVQISKM